MRHNRTRRRLKRNFSHRKQMLENLVTSLFKHQQVRTTVPKAKEAQKLADQLITLGKDDTLHARRQVFAVLQDHGMTTELFSKIAPRFKSRQGGYTRVLHVGTRKGDAAPIALLELTEKEVRMKKVIKHKVDKTAKHDHDEHGHAHGDAEHGHEKRSDVAPHETHRKPEGPKKELKKPSFLKNMRSFFSRKQGGE